MSLAATWSASTLTAAAAAAEISHIRIRYQVPSELADVASTYVTSSNVVRQHIDYGSKYKQKHKQKQQRWQQRWQQQQQQQQPTIPLSRLS
jgi:hypothetical protein